MALFRIEDIFDYRSTSPSGLVKGNLISFKYKSPNGVHDAAPLVFVLDKTFDKIYGLNVHYDNNDLQALTERIAEQVDTFMENKFYSKYPKKRQELREQRLEFNKGMVDPKDYIEFKRGFNKRDLENFPDTFGQNETNFRCYLYKRMNNVSKLIWKL